MPPRQAKIKSEDDVNPDIPWKSRFPVARIKKIMQADEDVGKVAQVVPVIISKAVELFMASLIQEASRHASETGHKRVVPGHLRMAIKSNTMFDFLEQHVEKIPDPVHVESRQPEERKIRKPRTSKKHPDLVTETSDIKSEELHRVSSSNVIQPTKRIKLEETSSNPASRMMSIANMISPSTGSANS
ncbi:DNA polymerase epsilon subunit C [Taphrina deformans PYCC 5710]|uniref:DNA polymerase epsilon subunit C n=1 Tax=Taphrina deformans (strain PYCC 5710 / ATCC 11124 / CBS 356.35 / IMI 108563 / JCM 9778 / NBRC 8474) TaxID=1097556 RepID=R4XDF0_TAPDE|nr:DNA polymerase epsilon subunit C [Taphrina deformans PYCC 5710]|eukprot:CCG81369.1 DNA polymerase epsilon subunit C [Taphrina deformans PYCC 5710]